MLDPWKEYEAYITGNGLRSGWLRGKTSGCPFCLARGRTLPQEGERVRVLFELPSSRRLEGREGTVIEKAEEGALKPREIRVEMDNEPSRFRSMIINIDRLLVETLPTGPLPTWAPPISLKAAGPLDLIAMRLCDEETPGSHPTPDTRLMYEFIGYVWKQRLPLTAEEVWAVLEAHGAPLEWRHELIRRYAHGMEALVCIVGRKPFKNRRVPPLSL